jgi:hypothetical protein
VFSQQDRRANAGPTKEVHVPQYSRPPLPLQNFSAAICRDQRVAKLLRTLAPFVFDGSETFRTINAELRNPEDETVASAIRHAVLSQYRDTVPIDAAIEIVGRLLEDGELA